MSVKDTLLSIAKSWCETEGKVHTTAEILDCVPGAERGLGPTSSIMGCRPGTMSGRW